MRYTALAPDRFKGFWRSAVSWSLPRARARALVLIAQPPLTSLILRSQSRGPDDGKPLGKQDPVLSFRLGSDFKDAIDRWGQR